MTISGAFFSDVQLELVTQVLNRIIPANDRMPGAGQIAVGFLDGIIGRSASLKRRFGNGLFRIQAQAQQTHSKNFTSLSDAEKDVVLHQVETAEEEFFDTLVRQTYNGYYTDPRVVELLGLEVRPPQPKGHQLDQGDFRPLESVKKRGVIYRDT